VGVIEHVRAHRLREPGLPQVYLPFGKYLDRVTDMHFAVRAEGNPRAAMPAIREIFRDVAPTRPLAQVRTLDDYVADAYGDVRIALVGLTGFAGLATVMAIAGLYGVLSFVVSRRTREFGCRLALGASRQHLLRLVLRQGSVIGGAGLVAGLLAAGAMTSVIQGLLFGVAPLDVATFTAVSALVLATVLVASLVPAVRATRVDPIRILRVE
jgi:putative ABC transport system permease protein